MYYTMGQRKGIGIGGLKDSTQSPWYVVDKDIQNNILIVGQGHDHPRMLHNVLECRQLHWINKNTTANTMNCAAKIRYRQSDQSCRTEQLDNDYLKVIFDKPQRAITPGQSIVFYNNEECLGGGIIESMYNNET
jgi:tRNA-specific 2-thiouridylase